MKLLSHIGLVKKISALGNHIPNISRPNLAERKFGMSHILCKLSISLASTAPAPNRVPKRTAKRYAFCSLRSIPDVRSVLRYISLCRSNA